VPATDAYVRGRILMPVRRRHMRRRRVARWIVATLPSAFDAGRSRHALRSTRRDHSPRRKSSPFAIWPSPCRRPHLECWSSVMRSSRCLSEWTIMRLPHPVLYCASRREPRPASYRNRGEPPGDRLVAFRIASFSTVAFVKSSFASTLFASFSGVARPRASISSRLASAVAGAVVACVAAVAHRNLAAAGSSRGARRWSVASAAPPPRRAGTCREVRPGMNVSSDCSFRESNCNLPHRPDLGFRPSQFFITGTTTRIPTSARRLEAARRTIISRVECPGPSIRAAHRGAGPSGGRRRGDVLPERALSETKEPLPSAST